MDMNVVIKRLEEAGIYDQSLKKDEMLVYYNAIKDSETSALENMRKQQEVASTSEDDQMESSPEKPKATPFTPKQWVCDKTVESDTPDMKEQNNSDKISVSESSEELEKVNIVNIDIEDERKELCLRLGDGNPLMDSDFVSKDFDEKVLLLCAHHTKLEKERESLARKLLNFAPMPKVITASSSTSDIFESKSDIENTYISRSGRQTKRKNYSYNDNPYDDYVSDTDDATLSTTKKTKMIERIPKISKKVLTDTPTSTTHSPSTSVLGVLDTETPKSDYRNKKKLLTNEEIIKRSPLFADNVKSARKDMMMERARLDDEKKKQQEREMSKVMASIDNEDDENEDDIITIEEKSPVKRRVVPKCPVRKRGLALKKDNYDISEEPSTSATPSTSTLSVERIIPIQLEDASSSVPTTTTTKKATSKRTQKKSSEEIEVSEASEVSTVACPICGKDYPLNVIQEHASGCEFQVETTQVEEVHSTLSSSKRIMCEICDRVFPLNTNYEVHVSECIAARRGRR